MDWQVVLSNVNTVRARQHRDVGAVVHEKNGAGLPASPSHRGRELEEWAEGEVFGAQLDQRDAGIEPCIKQAGRRNRALGDCVEIEDGVKPGKGIRECRDRPALCQADSASEPFFSLGSGM